MIRKKLTFVAGVLAVLAGCSKGDMPVDEAIPGKEPIDGIEVKFGGQFSSERPADAPEGMSRVAMDDQGYVKLTWQDTDRIGIFAENGASGINLPYKVVPDADDPTLCTFVPEGTAVTWDGQGTPSFYAYYPYSADVEAKHLFYFEIQSDQSADPATYFILTAKPTQGVSASGSVSLNFTMPLSLMQFVLSAEDSVTLSSLEMNTHNGAYLCGDVMFDLSRPYEEYMFMQGSGFKVKREFPTGLQLGPGETASVYFVVEPIEHQAGSVSLTFTDTAGRTFTKYIWTTKDVIFKPAIKHKQVIAPLRASDFS